MPVHRRRWMQFQLGTLLVAVVIVCGLALTVRFAGFLLVMAVGGLCALVITSAILFRVMPILASNALRRLLGWRRDDPRDQDPPGR
jgi:hypothetical protein